MDYVLAEAETLLAFALSLVLGVYVHEFAHAGAAAALGMAPRLVNLGRGDVVFRRRIARTWIVVRTWPIQGFVRYLPRGRDRRNAAAGVTAAGPLANLVLCGVFVAANQTAPAASTGDFVFAGLAAAQAGLAINALLPRRFRVGRDRRVHFTDGMKLIRFLRRRDPDDLELLVATFMRRPGATEPGPSGLSAHGPEVLYQLARQDLATERWARADSIEVLRGLSTTGHLSEPERVVVTTRLAIASANPALF